MLYGILSDVHSDTAGARIAIDLAAAAGARELISLGDVFECRVESGQVQEPVGEVSTVLDWDAGLAELLKAASLVRGNQEERITRGLRPDAVPALLQPFLDAPLRRSVGSVVFAHGHEFAWLEIEEDHWIPAGWNSSARVLVHGHHHRNSVLALPETERDWTAAVDVTPTSGVPLALGSGLHYLINVGPARGATPSWALYDEDRDSITLNYTSMRQR